MWKRIINWYEEWEQEQLDVLADPSRVATVQPGYRMYVAKKLAELSPIERHELRTFSIKYQGRRLWIALGKLLLGSSALGLLLHVTVDALSLIKALVLGNLIGFFGVIGVVSVWFGYRRVMDNKVRYVAFFAACAVAGALAGAYNSNQARDGSFGEIADKLPRVVAVAMLAGGGLVIVPLMLVSVFRNNQYEALTAQLKGDAERERLSRELSESQLRVLRAQIEPHFLFNTLGAVQQLAEHGAPRAAELTANLIAFLRASMTEMRSDQVGLGAEFQLVESYLQVMQARLGSRLAFSVQLPEALTQVAIPSMVVLTLVENAIKHGIEPALRGGAIDVSAGESGGVVTVQVRDTGAGLSGVPGQGVGLDNVRRRLQLIHGDAAAFAIADSIDGVLATITLPLHRREQAA